MYPPALQEYDSLDFFSGNSNFTKVMRMSGLKAARFDVLYCSKDRKHNYMDILSSPGLALLGSICSASLRNPKQNKVGQNLATFSP